MPVSAGASLVTLKEELEVESTWGLSQAQQILGRTEMMTTLLLIVGLLCFLALYAVLDSPREVGLPTPTEGTAPHGAYWGQEGQAAKFMSVNFFLARLHLIESDRNTGLRRDHPGCPLAYKAWTLLAVSQSHIFLSEESELQTQNKVFGQLNDRDKQTWERVGSGVLLLVILQQ